MHFRIASSMKDTCDAALKCSHIYCCFRRQNSVILVENNTIYILNEGDGFPHAGLAMGLSWSHRFTMLTNKKMIGLKAAV